MKTIVIFSGAGLSAESGIPTFRDSNGLWHNHKVEDVATQQGWRKNKQLVLDFYKARMENVVKAKPNDAHKAIAKLQDKFNVINITQNIDDLLERIKCKNVWHLHGDLLSRKCEYHLSILDDPKFTCDYLESHTEPVKLGDLCPKCNYQCRPNVVWFGEKVDMKNDSIKELIKITDIFITVGTSVQVYPAASFIKIFNYVSRKYIIDPNPVGSLIGFNKLKGTAVEKIPNLVDELLKQEI